MADMRVLAVDRGHSKSDACLLARLGPDGSQQISEVVNDRQQFVLVVTVDTHRTFDRYVHQITVVPNLDHLVGELLQLIADVERLPMPKPLCVDIAYALEPAERDHIDKMLDARTALNLSHAAVQGHD